MKNFRTYQLAKEFYHDTKNLKHPPYLKNQFDRACHSIILNLAEGSAKPSIPERKRFYSIALASYRECQAILDIENQHETIAKHDSLGAHLYRLTRF